MPLPRTPWPGLVICYEFLWGHDHQAGSTQGEKRRPCVIVTAIRERMGQTIVTVAPVTHSEPRDPRHGVEIPARVKAHLHLDQFRSWIIATDLNEFIWPGEHVYPIPGGRPDQYDYGTIPSVLFDRLKSLILALSDADTQTIPRDPED